MLMWSWMAACVLPTVSAAWQCGVAMQQDRHVARRSASPACCAPESARSSFRQRLKAVRVEPAVLAEVTAVVTHRKASGRHQSSARADSAAAALPLHNPFGAKPQFMASAGRAESLPPEGLPEVAFIGRSNVGKSSLVNAFTGVAALAKVSDKPGRTQALNFFELGRKDSAFLLVDMPGCMCPRMPNRHRLPRFLPRAPRWDVHSASSPSRTLSQTALPSQRTRQSRRGGSSQPTTCSGGGLSSWCLC